MLYNTDRIRNGGPVMGNDIILKTEKLTKQYNMVRQSAITREITEISAGAKALRRKKQKKENKQ